MGSRCPNTISRNFSGDAAVTKVNGPPVVGVGQGLPFRHLLTGSAFPSLTGSSQRTKVNGPPLFAPVPPVSAGKAIYRERSSCGEKINEKYKYPDQPSPNK